MSALIVFLVGGYQDTHAMVDALQGRAELIEVADAAEAIAYLDQHDEAQVPLLIVNANGVDTSSTLLELYADPRLEGARNLVVTRSEEHRDLAPAIDAGCLQAIVPVPSTYGTLVSLISQHVHAWMVEHELDPIRIIEDSEGTREGIVVDLLYDLSETEDELTGDLVAAIDRAFARRRPRIILPPGVRLTRQGTTTRVIYIVIEGNVALTRSTDSAEDLLMHHASTGRIVGILSLAGEDEAFFTSTTTSETVVIMLSLEELSMALRRDPEIAAGFAVSAIRSLSQRLLRAEELQEERDGLMRKLRREHRKLQKTLKELEMTRSELVAQAKFATLGELSAGVAHELNNPVAALRTAGEYLQQDVGKLLAAHPHASLLEPVTEGILEGKAISTSEERSARRAIERAIGNPERAFRLVAAGVTDPKLAGSLSDAELDEVEAAASIAMAARNIETASHRIQDLVQSLRSHARPESEFANEVDINLSIDETLDLVSHRLHGIEVECSYGEIPPVLGQATQLGQVWTNLLVNAADALGGEGRITVSTALVGDDTVRVQIADNGPGISPGLLKRIFEPRFTTKRGTVRYGMGLGLSVTRTLVRQHGGEISVESRPGHTVFTVMLPTHMEEKK